MASIVPQKYFALSLLVAEDTLNIYAVHQVLDETDTGNMHMKRSETEVKYVLW